MRKYLVPCAALLGLALLGPRVDAATQLGIKSRVIPPGGRASLPVYAVSTGLGAGVQVWAIDAGVKFDNAALTAVDPNAAFVPETAVGTTDVVVTGNTFVVNNASTPSLYFGYARGAAGYDQTKALGLLKLQVAAGTALRTVIDIAVPATYNVENDGNAGTVDSRAGATAATSTATAGAPVNAEPVTLMEAAAGSTSVPMHKVGVGGAPGDVNGDGAMGLPDASNIVNFVAGRPIAAWSTYKAIAADVTPGNGYTAADIGGTNGFGYGDGTVGLTDASAIVNKIAGRAIAANFPVNES